MRGPISNWICRRPAKGYMLPGGCLLVISIMVTVIATMMAHHHTVTAAILWATVIGCFMAGMVYNGLGILRSLMDWKSLTVREKIVFGIITLGYLLLLVLWLPAVA